MPISYITHKGKEILYCDYRDLKTKELVLENLELMVKFYRESEGNLLVLADVRGTFSNPEIVDKVKYYGKQVFAGKSTKRAILGITGIKAILLKGYNLFTNTEMRPFDNEESAMDYLIS